MSKNIWETLVYMFHIKFFIANSLRKQQYCYYA